MDKLNLIFLLLIPIIIIFFFKIIGGGNSRNEPEKVEMRLNPKQKRLIARWFNSHDSPDHDGYLGHYVIPSSVMDVYRKLYPGDWD